MVFVRKNWIAISALLTKLKEVDCLLTSMDQQESVSKMNRKHQRFVIILMVVHNLCFATLAEIYTAWVNPHASLHFFIVYTYPRLVCSTVNIKFVVYASILRGRFKIINDFISAKLSTDRDFCEQLTRVVSLHKLLVQLSRQLNSIFSLHLLMWLAICFGLLVGDLYAGLYVIFFDSRSAFHLALILITYKNCVVSAFDIWSFAKMCNELSHEANRTKVAILKVKVDVKQHNERDLVAKSVLKLMNNKLEMTAHKLFTINNNLLFSNGRLEFSKPALLQTFAFLTTGTVLTAMFIVNFHKYVPYVPSKHNVMIKTAIMLRNSGSMVVTLIVVLSGYRNYFKLKEIKNTISRVDSKLIRMEGGECLAQDNYKKHNWWSLDLENVLVGSTVNINTVE
ncbi:hypothetical protein GEV33_000959 [Tenebrio molitor]|uniref:Gustatory receptor n=1 Tax=Tenebrio molitor TaxID=7067 RepID=A0A8J6HX36_TENMO|nr:hypothetical protein GEV33_000959 [Tenebrio molitor]